MLRFLEMDMSKSYDRVEWEFLENTMRRMGFAEKWVSRVMLCVNSVTYFVKVNDHISGEIKPERGLRQGDPLSPYLFLLCSEVLSAMLMKGLADGALNGIRINRKAPVISHLFFADDSMFFLKSSTEEANNLKKILTESEDLSGQRINKDKSEISFSRNTSATDRSSITEIFGVHQVDNHSRYLGLPLLMGQKRTEAFKALTEKVWKRTTDWKNKFLLAA
ncbi:unnamed protein product [Rhodiola kirilowii]